MSRVGSSVCYSPAIFFTVVDDRFYVWFIKPVVISVMSSTATTCPRMYTDIPKYTELTATCIYWYISSIGIGIPMTSQVIQSEGNPLMEYWVSQDNKTSQVVPSEGNPLILKYLVYGYQVHVTWVSYCLTVSEL